MADPVVPNVDPAVVPAAEPTPVAAAVALRPDWLPESYWDAQKNAANSEALTKDLTDLQTLRTEQESRAKDVPQDGAYKFELPEDFKLPDGVTYQAPDANDPEVKAFFDLAKARQWPQSMVRELLGFEAQRRLTAFQTGQKAEAARAAEMKSLGETAAPRVEQAQRWLNANFTEGEAKILSFVLGTKDGVLAVEKMIDASKHTMRGLPGGSPAQKNPLDALYPTMARN